MTPNPQNLVPQYKLEAPDLIIGLELSTLDLITGTPALTDNPGQ